MTASRRIPLPPRLDRAAARFVGRGDEQRLIADAWARASAGPHREIVLIAGEAGVGKTSLTTRAARAAFDDGAIVLFGHCDEDLVAPYQLFAEVLNHYVTHAPEEALKAHVAEYGPALLRLAPALARRLPDLQAPRAADADAERSLLFAAATGLLADAAAEHPVMLVLDDIQWADEGGLSLLRRLAAADRPMRLMAIATYRDNEAGALLDTLAALHRQPGVRRLELKGLNDAEVLEFVEAMAGDGDASRAVARAIREETDGNAFFVEELLRHLQETGALAGDGRWASAGATDRFALPASLRDVISARIARLGPENSRTLGLAAVIGRDFDFELLARVAGADEGALLDMLDAASAAALIQELPEAAGRYRFAHALIQHALYQDMGAARRVVAHRKVANALEQIRGAEAERRLGELARHWGHAPQPHDVPKAVDYAYRAGSAALGALAPGVAKGYFASAGALIDQHGVADSALEIDVAIGLGLAQRQSGDPAFRQTLLNAGEKADRLGDAARLVRAALAIDRGWHSAAGATDTEKVALLERALQRTPAQSPDRPLILGALCSELAFGATLDHRLTLAEEAIALARATRDDAIIVRTLNQMAFSLAVPSLYKSLETWTEEALERATRLGDPLPLYYAAMYRATSLIRVNDIAAADACYAIAGKIVRQLELPPLSWEYTFHMSKRAQIAGDLDRAEKLAGEAATIGAESGQPDAQMCFGVQMAAITWMRGAMGAFAPMLEALIAANPGLPTIRASLAMAYGQAQQFEDAVRILEEFADTNYDLPQDAAWLNGMTEYADAAIACRDPRFAAALYDVLAPWADHFSSAGGLTAEGPVCLCLGGLATVLGRYDDADRFLAQSEEICERNEMRFYAALTSLRRGQMLMARGSGRDRDMAKALLASARGVAAENGYGAIERDAAAQAGST